MRSVPEWMRSGAEPDLPFVPPTSGDALGAFLRWYGERGPSFPLPPVDGPFFAGGLAGVSLYREGAFQVELFLFPPGTKVPPHRHPHVDTIEMHVAGDFDFRVTVEGQMVSSIPLEFLHARKDGHSRWWGRGVRVRPDTVHELEVGPSGACFLSLQHWIGRAPTTVGEDWDGRPVNPAHASLIAAP